MKAVLAIVLAMCLATGALAASCSKADYSCLSNTTFCQAGRVLTCGAGTRCVAGGSKSRSPCIRPAVKTCVDLPDYQCFTATSFCQAGKELKCAAGTVCRGTAPCATA
ncbi:hypothetical protein ABPG75_005062 [Micractinium tetrahymenae]